MPSWLILFGAIWLFFAVTGRRGCGSTRTGAPHRRAALPSDARHPGLRRSHRGHVDRARGPRAARSETVEERLQRQFVEGRLSLDEYEDALWRELRPGRDDEPGG